VPFGVPGPFGVPDPFGVYVHIPFCAKRCDYCAFATWTDRTHLVDDYLDACRTEIGRAVAAGQPRASSVFFGGGTPSLVPPDALMAVLDAIPRTGDAEVTVECNPDTVTAGLLASYRAGGVNRISLGVQSMLDTTLRSLGRTHDPANVERAVALVRAAGFETFNVDLIYGAAGETLDDWRRSLDAVLALAPPHLSAYALTIEAGTPLADDPDRHPDDDDQADKYALADAALLDAGLENYEISNWARPGHECRHNLLYWSQGDYRGIGCAAHSHEKGRRWWNVRTPDRYLDLIRSGGSAEGGSEELDDETRRFEALELALRMRDGVPVDALPVGDAALPSELFVTVGDRARLTVPGRLVANEIAVRLRTS